MNRQVRLDNEAHDKLMEPINGQGGLQRLLRKLQSQYDQQTKILIYNDEDRGKINRYANDYKNGGYQDRFRAILRCIGDRQ